MRTLTYAEIPDRHPFILGSIVYIRTQQGAHRLLADGSPSGCMSQLRPTATVQVVW